ncbi:MAG: copper amine oxidase N-terminal domain-containing protein [Defluviitaleaceae bacterium]|nr:copper amine oxidase N-terminal domain-containing protein [Defluviitaleaceae bacterium]
MNKKSKAKRLVALFVAVVMMATLLPAMLVSADQDSWQAAINSDFIATRGPGGMFSATDDGILVADRLRGQHDHNNGMAINVAALRDAVAGAGVVVIEVYAPDAEDGHAMMTQGLQENSAVPVENGTAVITIPADMGFNMPGWLWSDWGGTNWPVICTEHTGQNWDFTVTAIWVDGTHIFELIGLDAPEGASPPVAAAADDSSTESETASESATEDDTDEATTEEETSSEEVAQPLIPIVPVMAQTATLVLTVGSENYTAGLAAGTLPVAPVIMDGRTMVPFRFIGEILGAEVDWNPDTETAYFIHGGTTLALPIGVPLYDDAGVAMGTPVIEAGRTLVPVRFVSVRMGTTVDWDGELERISIPVSVDNLPAADLVAAPSGMVVRHVQGTSWGQMVIEHEFSYEDYYTISFAVMHESTTFGISPYQNPAGGFNFTDADGTEIGWHGSTAGEWVGYRFTFRGGQSGGGIIDEEGNRGPMGIRFASAYPRAIGSVFYIDNILITNSAGAVVYSNDFESGLAGAREADWSEGEVSVVPVPGTEAAAPPPTVPTPADESTSSDDATDATDDATTDDATTDDATTATAAAGGDLDEIVMGVQLFGMCSCCWNWQTGEEAYLTDSFSTISIVTGSISGEVHPGGQFGFQVYASADTPFQVGDSFTAVFEYDVNGGTLRTLERTFTIGGPCNNAWCCAGAGDFCPSGGTHDVDLMSYFTGNLEVTLRMRLVSLTVH